MNLQNIRLDGNSVEQKREEIREYFLETYKKFETLFELFVDDTVFYEQPEKLRHKLIFYFGHTASFYINKLIIGKYIENRINPKFESIFAIGVDEMVWDDLENIEFPSVDDTRKYRDKVKEVVLEYIDNVKFSLPITWESDMWVILMGIEHENIHIETSSVLHRQLDISKVKEHKDFVACSEYGEAPTNELLDVKGSTITLGKSHDANDFYGWDNEYGQKIIEVDDFKASKYLVSNGEFLEFLENDGYIDDSLWDEEGLDWKNKNSISLPTFWIKENTGYKLRTLTNIIDLPLNWPVEVNAHEANAFCRFLSRKLSKNITLPSEAQYQRLREVSNLDYEVDENSNVGKIKYASSTPVNMYCQGDFYDVVGNVWQWSSSCIDSYDGFKVHWLYDDFSTPTFDNRHALIKGGSWITRGNGILKDSRYAFRKHFYQHAGFRYIENSCEVLEDIQEYKDEQDVASQCERYYLDDSTLYNDIAKFASKWAKKDSKVLNIGCGVGRISFELKRYFDKVIGIDFSARFIVVATKLKDRVNINFDNKKFNIDNLGFEDIDFDGLEFWQGDASNLKPHFNSFDIVVVNNLLDKLYDKSKFLNDLKNRVVKDGIVILYKNDIKSIDGFEKIESRVFKKL